MSSILGYGGAGIDSALVLECAGRRTELASDRNFCQRLLEAALLDGFPSRALGGEANP